MATSSFDDSNDSGTAVSFCVCTECWMRAATPSRTVWSVYDYHHSVSFSQCSQACLFYGGNNDASIVLQSANWTIVGTRSVTLNSVKGLLFAISCFMKRTLTRNKEGHNQDKMLRF